MSSESVEVAEDYRHALEDLSGNMRFEISNLTVIARENTEHALAIADVLQQHILKTAPSKKLPALYVLDSIVKNVGTPYTLYFGRNLFKIFMESYAVVEYKTRQRMEEMLKTWKQPVAGSMDTRPVFSPELVRPIENALMKAKAASMPQGQLPGRPRQAMQPPHRNTPTPPGGRGFGAPPVQQPQHYPYANGVQPGYPNQQQAQHQRNLTPQPASSSSTPVPPMSGSYGAPAQGAGVNVEALSSDIQNLIVVMQVELAQNPHDPSVQTRLKALRDLQGIVGRTALPQDQLELIKKQVNDLAAGTMKATSANNSASATPQPQSYVPPHPYYQQQHHHQGQVPASAPAPAAAPSTLSLDSLLGQGAMAALLARSSSQNTTPTPPQPAHALRSPQPAQAQPQHAPAQTQNPMSLVEQLRAAGLMPAATPSNASSTPVAPPPAPPAAPSLPLNLSSLLSSSSTLASLLASTQQKKGFDSLSLKQQYVKECLAFNTDVKNRSNVWYRFRPDLVARLHEDLGPPCTQCGRRFRTDAAGKNAKMAHMDWHFKVHQRSTEAEKRGMHRSWYVDHNDWLKSREVVDSDHVASSQDASAQASRAAESEAASVPRYIRVPEPTSGVNNFCSICQDKFENKWLDTAQEWVWLDAVLVGGRAYHASCHDEATRDRDEGGVGGMMRRTPEPLLGKRKADTGLASPKVRSLKTSA